MVSLLNEDIPRQPSSFQRQQQQQQQQQNYLPRHDSTSSSHSSAAPSLSSETPSLSRSDSDDSRVATSSPTPTTPPYAHFAHFAHLHQYPTAASSSKPFHFYDAPRPRIMASNSFFNNAAAMQNQFNESAYPVLTNAPSEYAFPPAPQGPPMFQQQGQPTVFDQQQQQLQQQQLQQQQQQQGYPQPITAPKPPQKKNQYPCPVSKQYNCNEFFTTSGHAARHAKKHTGKKDAICPECNKAFTRKDNMEQHRRTHSGFRATPKSASSGDERAAKKLKMQQRKGKAVPTMDGSMPSAIPTAPMAPQQIQTANMTQNLGHNGMNLNMSNMNHLNNMNNMSNLGNMSGMNGMNSLSANMAANILNLANMSSGVDSVLDPMLRESPMMYNSTDDLANMFRGQQQQQQQQQALPQAMMQRPLPPNPFTLDMNLPSRSDGQSPGNTPPVQSPSSAAPALDALALAASRQDQHS